LGLCLQKANTVPRDGLVRAEGATATPALRGGRLCLRKRQAHGPPGADLRQIRAGTFLFASYRECPPLQRADQSLHTFSPGGSLTVVMPNAESDHAA